MTMEQFEALPGEVTDHHELVEGELIPVLIRDNLLFRLKAWSSSHDPAKGSERNGCPDYIRDRSAA
jgi:hypothetical protein